jgi:hypothetical protein
MWIVVTTKNLNFFKQELRKKILDVKFYHPKIKTQNKTFSKNLLGNYLFCNSSKFKCSKSIFLSLQFTKGLKKILFSNEYFQREITNFIDFCKSHEDNEGYIANTFFKSGLASKGKILNGPFSNHIFKLLSKNNKNIKVIVGDIKLTILDKSKINYSTI